MALTFNLPSQIVVQTAAQWAVDATVYSNKRILVTSDAYYGSTDQRKFKIADGTQTWSNLDYMPISQTLAQVLVNGNTTGGGQIESDNGFSELRVEDSESLLAHYDTGGIGGEIRHNTTKTNLFHSLQIDLDAPTISLPQATVSRIVETDASKNLTYAAKNTGYNLALGTTAGTVLEGNRITQVITNGVTDKAPSEDAVYDALATKQDGLIFKQNTTITHTGTTSPTVIASFPIPIGFNEANDFWHIWGMCGVDITGGGAGNNQIRMYIGPNPTDIVGATYAATAYVASTLRTYPIARTFVFKNSLTTFEGNGLAIDNIQTDYTTSSNAPASVTIDFSTQQYLHIVCILINVGNIIYLRSLYSKILR